MGRLFATLIMIGGLVWGFSYLTSDPFGATTRTAIETQAAVEIAQNEAQASVQVAEWQAQASIQVAESQAWAQIKSAQAAAEAVKVEAQERRRSSEAWATILPLLLLIVAVAGGLWIVLTYRGRAFLALAQQGIDGSRVLAEPTDYESLPPPSARRYRMLTPEEQLARYAALHNQRVLKENGCFLLVDKRTNRVVKQLVLKG